MAHKWTLTAGNPTTLRHLRDNFTIANDREYAMCDGNTARQYRRVNGHDVVYVAADGRAYPASARADRNA